MDNILLTSAGFKYRLAIYIGFIAFWLAITSTALGQSSRGRSGYSPPVDSVLIPSGNFAEIRPNHFHSGIDIKTGGKIGWPVYAAERGYISRAKISSYGFGKVLYINHPGNVTTVYAHLHAFTGTIADTLQSLQKHLSSFEVEIFPPFNKFEIQKGQLIGYTGSSGSSFGPHLHYEYRHTQSQKPYDPGIAGFIPVDTIKPQFEDIVIYIPGEFNGLFGAERFLIDPLDIAENDTIAINANNFFVGFSFIEKANRSENRLGLKSYKLYANNDLSFSCSVDSFLYSETRFSNSLIDYSYRKLKKKTILLCYKMPGNKLPYVSSNEDVFEIGVDEVVKMNITIEDRAGNLNDIEFYVKNGNNSHSSPGICFADAGVKVNNKKNFKYRKKDIQLRISAYSTYENIRINVSQGYIDTSKSNYTYRVGNQEFPLHKNYELKIKYPVNDPKTSIVYLSDNDSIWLKSKYVKTKLETKTRHLGDFIILRDTIAPPPPKKYITGLDSIVNKRFISFKVYDNLSGVGALSGTLNGNPIIVEYNAMHHRAVIYFDSIKQEQSYTLKLQITDNAGNKNEFSHFFEDSR
jgi:peptidase M23-like protein